MRLSTRNQLVGTVAEIETGAVMAVVKVDLDGGQRVTASVTKDAVDELEIRARLLREVRHRTCARKVRLPARERLEHRAQRRDRHGPRRV